ncbi:hypothetical protein ACQP1G_43830 [Nocardia sp. CA-107356]|uniref:hypothetical protein n=1 Tax=Nocardia sp. CA-107356 TaxID=3239972 RepID=UPI003D9339B8
MAVQGFYNHYDDPDEFWDDAPLDRQRPNRTPAAAAPTPTVPKPEPPLSQPTSRRAEQRNQEAKPPLEPPSTGSSFASMELDRGFLPVRIEFSSGWSRSVGPHEVAEELMLAYRGAVSLRLARLYSSGRWPSPQEVSDTAVPDHRTVLMLLLDTETWEQYSDVSSRMIRDAGYDVYGSVVFHDEHPVRVSADRTYLQSITVWPEWAGSAESYQIADEILWCADQIRSLRPRFEVRGDYSRYADADLEYHLDRHRERLFDERVG